MMEIRRDLVVTIKQQLKAANRVLVISHQRPDGDAIGSLLAVGLALIDAGKDVQMVLKDGIPANYRFLAGNELVRTEPIGDVDYIIVVDSAEIERTDTDFNGYHQPDLNIDHHKTNNLFGKLNLVESQAVATAEILTRYIPELGFRITPRIANALIAGIITDTIGFRTTNVYPQVLRLVAGLMEQGGDLADIYYKTLVEQSLAAARYWGAGLSRLEQKHGMVWATLTAEDRKKSGYGGNDDADLINMVSAIEGNKVGMIFVEQNDHQVKVSWRALEPGIDVSKVAQHFNGGGHAAAAGADIPGTLADVQPLVLKTTEEMLSI